MELKATFFLFKDNKLKSYQPSLNDTKPVITVFSRDNNDIVIRVPDDFYVGTSKTYEILS